MANVAQHTCPPWMVIIAPPVPRLDFVRSWERLMPHSCNCGSVVWKAGRMSTGSMSMWSHVVNELHHRRQLLNVVIERIVD